MLPSTRDGRVSVRALLRRLGKAGFLHVLCEGGGELAEALVDAGMVDRYRFVFAGRLIGGRGRAAVGGAGWRLAAAPNLRIVSVERLGSDVLLTAEPAGVRQRRGKGAANSCLRG
jgi:diaminohydroxyphosphoribosylaminopyrimidine deaminase/5-amino-6-(5-phosphoribosylamino)uracil reductase